MGSSVYFAQRSDGLVKIGFSENVQRRVSAISFVAGEDLETLATVPGGRSLEAHFHEKFVADRVRGEWFRKSEDLMAFIETIRSSGRSAIAAGFRDTQKSEDTKGREIEARELLRDIILNVAGDQPVGTQKKALITVAARRTGLSISKIEAAIYRETVVITFAEMMAVFQAVCRYGRDSEAIFRVMDELVPTLEAAHHWMRDRRDDAGVRASCPEVDAVRSMVRSPDRALDRGGR